MITVAKLVVAGLVFAGTFFFSYWLLFVQVFPQGMDWLAVGAALLAGGIFARWVWLGLTMRSGGILTTVLVWGAVVGAVGFCGGFFGPMIFRPEANQGPLLGIFITGPLGFVGGAIAGLFYSVWARSDSHVA
jgi:hypothetical protein